MMTPILTTLGFVMHPDAERVLMVHRIARPVSYTHLTLPTIYSV